MADVWPPNDVPALLAVANHESHRSLCCVALPSLQGQTVRLHDRTSTARYHRRLERGLYLDVPARDSHVFDVIVP